MTADRIAKPTIVIEVPWSETLTPYDEAHLTTYLRILDAIAGNASIEEMARMILDMDADLDPEAARRAVHSHARRARWLTQHVHLLSRYTGTATRH